jgi:hypothetical protein
VVETVVCFCGEDLKEVPCGWQKADEVECEKLDDDQQRKVWKGRFSCGKVCSRPYDCGIHTCDQVRTKLNAGARRARLTIGFGFRSAILIQQSPSSALLHRPSSLTALVDVASWILYRPRSVPSAQIPSQPAVSVALNLYRGATMLAP